jgi:hypothetical protein
MKVRHFQETDTLYIEFKSVEVSETLQLDENTILDLDQTAIFAELPPSTPVREQISRTSRFEQVAS